MPFLEFIGWLILTCLGIAVLCAALLFYVVIGVFIVGASLILGWIPIMMCLTDINMTVGEGFIGTWAWISSWVYWLCSLGLMALLWLRPDPDGLPPAWKFLALLYKVRDHQHTTSKYFDAMIFSSHGSEPMSVYAKRMWSSVFEYSRAKMLERRARADTETAEYLKKMRQRAEEAEALHRAETRRDTARDWMEKNGGRETKGD